MLDSPRESPWGKTTRDQKMGLEFDKKEYDTIDQYCSSKNIEWYASSWDTDSQMFLRQYNLKHNKVASAMLTNKKLLQVIAEEQKPTFISTGMSTMDEIKTAVQIFKDNKCSFELQHSNSSYPMKDGEANLQCIQTLKKEFDCNVGYSGHVKDPNYLNLFHLDILFQFVRQYWVQLLLNAILRWIELCMDRIRLPHSNQRDWKD